MYAWMYTCVTESLLPCHCTYISCYWKKYDCYIPNMSQTAIMLHGHVVPTYLLKCAKTQTTAMPTTQYCHICASNKYASQIPNMPHIQVSLYACDTTLSVSIPYISSLQSTMWLGALVFHIIGICPRTNMSATLHIYVPLYYYCSLHTDFRYK